MPKALPKSSESVKRDRTIAKLKEEMRDPAVQVNLSIPKDVYARVIRMARAEGFLNEGEVVRFGLLKFLKAGGY